MEEDSISENLPIAISNHYMYFVLFEGKQIVVYNRKDPKFSADLKCLHKENFEKNIKNTK